MIGRHLVTAVVTALMLLAGGFPQPSTALGAANPIVSENLQPGTDAWQIPSAGASVADDTLNQIKGYASTASVNKGQSVTFYVTVNPAQSFTLDVYRMGWYGGWGGRLMQHVDPLPAVQQPACPADASGMIACNWAPSYTLPIPTTWTDGVYMVVLTSAQRYQNYIPLVVRSDTRAADLLYQVSVNTYQAYNDWGGKSLYNYNSPSGRAARVSFDRPYHHGGSGDFFAWEVYMIHWLERSGYDVTYSASTDTHANGARLKNFKGFLSVGHEEYWSKAMYDAAAAARDAGVSLGFFGANQLYWQVRFEASTAGVPNRVIVCYKPSEPGAWTADPITATQPTLTTNRWRDPPVNRPEQALLGTQFTSQTGANWDNTVAYVVANSGHWVYAGTGVRDGDTVPGVVGFEADRQMAGFPTPTASGAGYTLLAQSPFTSTTGLSDAHNTSIYQAPSGAWVFAAGTMGWNYGLDRSGYADARIQRITSNVLDRFIANIPGPTPAATPPPIATPTAPPMATPTPAPSGDYRSTVLADQPLAYWRLGEASGTVASDEMRAFNGTYVGNPTLGRPGALQGDPNTAVAFDGTSQYVDVPYAAGYNPAVFSVETWAYPTGGAGTYRGAMGSRTFPQGWVLYAGSTDVWEFWINNGSSQMLVVAGSSVTLNAWSHIVGTCDGTTVRLYVNGVLVGSATLAAPYMPQTTQDLAIGQVQPGSTFFFPGLLDDPAIYGTVLSPAQVQRHYGLGITRPSTTPTPTTPPVATPTTPPIATPTTPAMATLTPAPSGDYRSTVLADQPLAYWRLGEASGTVASDEMRAFNGTYVGNPTLGRPGALQGDPNTAVAFDGTSQYVDVPYAAGYNPAVFSVETWAYPTGGAGTYRGAMGSRTFPQGWVLYAGSSDVWEFWINNGSADMLVVTGSSVTLNAWSHIVGTCDGTNVQLYVNGALVGSATLAAPYMPQANQDLAIGQPQPGSTLLFPGLLDDPAIYGTVLSPAQVQRHYSLGTTGR